MEIRTAEIALPADLMDFANSLVDGKRYAALDDVIVESLARFSDRHQVEAVRLARLRAEVQKGIDSADRGELYDEETVFAELDQMLAGPDEAER
jgi:Arc/MetJ-type ribon-helix-helix transcriptional regulator